ncbi:hypothetical protein IFM89_029498 [Coptis chinensis]|uniref:RNase H type-1 domain-containing protein n=1 Tax=Coptis chinensis TaxID=261450 RepID=A0A835HXB5_9MAGN|nr:hypothetical protein IFM89_029498 [Coptis chinensis]
MGRKCPPVSRLLFADDSFVFFRANLLEAGHVKDLLDLYCAFPRQSINNQKSSLIFSHNLPRRTKKLISDVLNIPVSSRESKYLGIPTNPSKPSKLSFNHIIDIVSSKIEGWHSECLSQAGHDAGLGFIAYNSHESTPFTGCDKVKVSEAKEVEALAVFNGLQASFNHGIKKVVVASDCLSLVTALSGNLDNLSWTNRTARTLASSRYGVFAMDYSRFGLSDGLHGYIPKLDLTSNGQYQAEHL